MNIGEFIRKIREEKELSINQLALYSDVSAAHISRIERGLREPSPAILRKISVALKVPYENLMEIAGYIDKQTDLPIPHVDDHPQRPTLTKKDERDMAKDLERIIDDLSQVDGLMFYNEPMTEEDKQLLKEAIEFGLRMAKMRNKENSHQRSIATKK